MKKDALVLSEGLQFTDEMLLSAIAMENEDPYGNLFEWAKKFGRVNREEGDGNKLIRVLRDEWIGKSLEREMRLTREERDMRDRL